MEIEGRYEECIWNGNPGGQTRADRQPFRYKAFVPGAIGNFDPQVPAGLAKLLSQADASVARLDRGESDSSARLEVYARQLLRQESLASSRIEGINISQKRLGAAGFDPGASRDRAAKEVVANIVAMQQAIEVGDRRARFKAGDLLAIHGELLGEHAPRIAGVIRDSQNWIGGSFSNPKKADFVPPPPEKVARLLDDLVEFVNLDDLPTTLQAAVAHAQFETVHPFVDGNGRVGRCLIHVIHRRAGVAHGCVPPVGLILARDVDRYVAGLTAYREGDIAGWTTYFAQATIEAAELGSRLIESTRALQESWRSRVRARAGSTAAKLIELLPGSPVIDIGKAAEITGASDEAARLAIASLAEGAVLRETTSRVRGKVWEAPEIWELLEGAESAA